MSDHGSTQRFFWGFFIIGLGFLFLLDNLGVVDFGDFVSKFWPLILILVGAKMILTRRTSAGVHSRGDVDSVDDSTSVNFNHNFGDVRLKLNSQEFTGGEVSNVFGSVEIDMEDIVLAGGSHKLNLKGVFGDMIIILPKSAPINISANTTFGSVRIKKISSSGISGNLIYKSEDFDSAENSLTIHATQVFGDIRVF